MLLLIAAVLMAVFFAIGLHVATALGLIGVTMMHFFSDRPLLDMSGRLPGIRTAISYWWPCRCL